MLTQYTEQCLFCRKPRSDEHHLVFGTANRKLSDYDDLTVPVCREHHELLHKNDKISRVMGQLAYERNKCAEGYSIAAARESFRKKYGKNYL